MAIYERDKIVAALEYLNDTLVQARGRENRSIAYDSDLYMAIEKWCEQNSIKFEEEKLDCPF